MRRREEEGGEGRREKEGGERRKGCLAMWYLNRAITQYGVLSTGFHASFRIPEKKMRRREEGEGRR
jgi:hypothetical protein